MLAQLTSKGFAEKWFVLEGCKSGEVQVSVQCLAALSRDSSKPPSVISSKPASRASSKPASKEPSRAPSIKSVEIVAEEDAVAPGKITINVFRAKKLDKKVQPVFLQFYSRTPPPTPNFQTKTFSFEIQI